MRQPTALLEPDWPPARNPGGTLWAAVSATLAKFDGRPTVTQLNEAARAMGLTNAQGMALRFERQDSPLSQRQYEQQIYHHGIVATRHQSWHDLFNACVWLTFGATKAALNAVHVRQPIDLARTPASDAATLFDESGAVLIGPDPRLAQWLADHDWHRAFVQYRHLWQTHHLLVIGHAIFEKLATLQTPYPGMIAKVAYLPWPAHAGPITGPPQGLDQALAANWLSQSYPRPANLFAMPILGVPGAHPENRQPHFYDNTEVFRPKRTKGTVSQA